MNTETVLDKLRDLAAEATKAGRPGHDRRKDEARKIIDGFMEPLPPSETVISALLESLTQRRNEQPNPSMAWDIYEAAIRRLPPIVRGPVQVPQGEIRFKKKN